MVGTHNLTITDNEKFNLRSLAYNEEVLNTTRQSCCGSCIPHSDVTNRPKP